MSDILTPEELAAIDARLEAATPGPWVYIEYPYDGVCSVAGHRGPVQVCRDPHMDDRPDDREFIAHAPEDLRRLRAEIDRLKRDLTQGVARMQVRAEQAERERDEARTELNRLRAMEYEMVAVEDRVNGEADERIARIRHAHVDAEIRCGELLEERDNARRLLRMAADYLRREGRTDSVTRLLLARIDQVIAAEDADQEEGDGE